MRIDYKTSILIMLCIALISMLFIARYLALENNQIEQELADSQIKLNMTIKEFDDVTMQHSNIKQQLDDALGLLNDTEQKLNFTMDELKLEYEKYIELSQELNMTTDALIAITNELYDANVTINDLKSTEYQLVYVGEFKITHYCNEPYEHICGFGDGLTAIGTNVKPGYTIAVDPKVIPYGTEVYIAEYGWRAAEDCGGGIRGNHIDVAVDTHAEAMKLGVQYKDVWLLVKISS